jgi:hypothetical protein
MFRFKSGQLLLVLILMMLASVFVVLFLMNRSIWAPARLVAWISITVLLVPAFILNLLVPPRRESKYPTRQVVFFMAIIIMIVIVEIGLAVLADQGTDPRQTLWVLIPMWFLPALAIVLLLLSSGLVFGVYREGEKIKVRSGLFKLEMFSGLGFLGLTSILIFNWLHSTKDTSDAFSFDGSSDQLQQTVIVPTLDTPIPDGKSAIWCASFQIAWNKFKTEVARGPVQIKGAELAAERLNQAEQSEQDLEPGSYYAAAGFTKDGIMEKIQASMRLKFPNVPKVDFHESGEEVAVAFGYLEAQVTFNPPFQEREGPIFFTNPKEETKVKFFGIPEKPGHEDLRDQVELLYEQGRDIFAVDLCKTSRPNQIVLASLPQKATLAETLSDLEKNSSDFQSKNGNLALGYYDTLGVPNMHWRISHHLSELEGIDKPLLNPTLQGTFIGEAIQVIEFKLDRRSAALKSQARLHALGLPRMLLFNHPFLLYMKKRGAKHPFFVMWVDNAELLIKK